MRLRCGEGANRHTDYGFSPVAEQVIEVERRKTENIYTTLAERGKRYGSFTGHAEITQRLKLIIDAELHVRRKLLAHDQQEALDMICHKIGRIINGDANYDDSWVDIAGYAQLVVDRLRDEQRP